VQSATVEQLRRRPRVVETPGFVAGFQTDDPGPYLNYATPLPGAEPTATEVAALVHAFRTRELLPRVEFVPAAAPAVAPALLAAGGRSRPSTPSWSAPLTRTPRTRAEPAPKYRVPKRSSPLSMPR
jgi:hypothetical protein